MMKSGQGETDSIKRGKRGRAAKARRKEKTKK